MHLLAPSVFVLAGRVSCMCIQFRHNAPKGRDEMRSESFFLSVGSSRRGLQCAKPSGGQARSCAPLPSATAIRCAPIGGTFRKTRLSGRPLTRRSHRMTGTASEGLRTHYEVSAPTYPEIWKMGKITGAPARGFGLWIQPDAVLPPTWMWKWK